MENGVQSLTITQLILSGDKNATKSIFLYVGEKEKNILEFMHKNNSKVSDHFYM